MENIEYKEKNIKNNKNKKNNKNTKNTKNKETLEETLEEVKTTFSMGKTIEYKNKDFFDKYAHIMDGKVKKSMQKRTKEFTNGELNLFKTKYNVDLFQCMQYLEQGSIEANFTIIYFGTNLSQNSVSFKNYVQYFDKLSPRFKIEFIEHNQEYINIVANLMGFKEAAI